MKKFPVLFLVSVVAALAFADVSEARWLRRRSGPPAEPCCPAPCCPVPAYAPYPPLAAQPLPAERVVVGAKGTYQMTDTGETGEFLEKSTPESPFGAGVPADDFAGHDRKKAKTSIASAPMEPHFSNVQKLLNSLTPEATMLALHISKEPNSDRVSQENRNVSVHGFIYAVKAEDDHDFHVILGMAPHGAQAFMNVEVSGLPQGGTFRAKLREPRNEFKAFFKEHGSHFNTSYKKFNPPIPVKLEGSLFFDADHPAGVVGPQGMRPKTAWEIHPVTKIEFEVDP